MLSWARILGLAPAASLSLARMWWLVAAEFKGRYPQVAAGSGKRMEFGGKWRRQGPDQH